MPVVTAPVDGPQLRRRRYTAAPRPTRARFLLTKDELATFEAFYLNDLKHGALSFAWIIRGDNTQPANFTIIGEPVIDHHHGLYWELGLDLVRLP